MKKKKILIIIFIIVILTSLSLLIFYNNHNNNLKEITVKEYEELIKNKESFILEIMKTDCSHCIDFKPKLIEVINEYDIEVLYINVGKLSDDAYDDFMKEVNVDGTPTVVFYKDGNEETTASRIVGSVSTVKIIEKFKSNGIIKE